MKHVACYCRVSTDEQAKFGFSIQAQKDALEKYCKENNYNYEFYVDEGISASSMKKRKALNEMLEKSSMFDMILFTKLDRLSRNVLDANNINKLLIDSHCTMKAIDEDDVDTSTADGLFMFNLKVSLAQREIGKTSERIKFVFDNKREKGEVTSGTCKYGYRIENKKFVINDEEAENLRNLYQEYLKNNGSLKQTYPYFIEHFKNKGFDAMVSYLHDTAYIGKYKLYRKEVYIENYIPQIIDTNLWNSVQNLKNKKTVTRNNTKEDIFSGLLFCSECGIRLSKKTDSRTSNVVFRYICDNNYRFNVGTTKKRCQNNKSIRQEIIEDYLLSNLPNEAEKCKLKYAETKEFIKKDNSIELSKIEKKINKLKDLYLDDLIDKDAYKKDYEALTNKIKELKKEVVCDLSKKDFSNIDKILKSDYKTIYNTLSTKNKKNFWLSIIDKIYIDNGKIKEVTFL